MLQRRRREEQREETTMEETHREPGTAEQPEAAHARKRRSFSSRVLDSGVVSEKKKRRALMKKFRKAKEIPSDAEERFNPSLDEGLTGEQVETRLNQFLFNDVNKRYSKSYIAIFVGNICTFFNLLPPRRRRAHLCAGKFLAVPLCGHLRRQPHHRHRAGDPGEAADR